MARAAAAARAELNKTLPWYRKKLGRARGEMAWQVAFGVNSFIVMVFIPVSIVYVTDAEFKKKYLPWFYRVRKVIAEEHDFPALIAAKREELKMLQEKEDMRAVKNSIEQNGKY
jgi:hypothetical protein